MEFKIRSRCLPRQAIEEGGCANCLFAPLLFLILCILLFVMAILTDRYLINSNDDEEKGYTVALLVTCGISSLIIAYLIYNTTKEACVVEKLEDWKILNYHRKKKRIAKEGQVANDSGFIDPIVQYPGVISRDEEEDLEAGETHRPIATTSENHPTTTTRSKHRPSTSSSSSSSDDSQASKLPLTSAVKRKEAIARLSQIGRDLTPIESKRRRKGRIPLSEDQRLENFRRSFHSYVMSRNKRHNTTKTEVISRKNVRDRTTKRSNARFRKKRLLLTEDSFMSQPSKSELNEPHSVNVISREKYATSHTKRLNRYLEETYEDQDPRLVSSFNGRQTPFATNALTNSRTAAAMANAYVNSNDSFTSVRDFKDSFESRMFSISSPSHTFIFNQSGNNSKSRSKSFKFKEENKTPNFTHIEVPEVDTERYVAEHGLETRDSRAPTRREMEGQGGSNDEGDNDEDLLLIEEMKSDISGQTMPSRLKSQLAKKNGGNPTRSVGNISGILGTNVEVSVAKGFFDDPIDEDELHGQHDHSDHEGSLVGEVDHEIVKTFHDVSSLLADDEENLREVSRNISILDEPVE